MKAIRILLGLSITILALFFGIYLYMGGFHEVEITRGKSFGPMEITFATHVGSYKNLSKTWTEFGKATQAAGLEKCSSVGIYLDPPPTPEDQLRSLVACDISNVAEETKATLRAKLPTFTLPQTPAMYTRFPFKNIASFFFAPMKVYPKVQEAMIADGIEPPLGIEVYGDENNVEWIEFFMPTTGTKADYQPLLDAFKK